jgi:hypothetical protein
MQWREPVYLWAQLIPFLILVGWIVAERRRRYRLTTFGDPRLLGVSPHAARQFLTISLLILVIGASVAVLALPVDRKQTEGVPATPLVAILLDARLANSTRSEVGYSMDEVEDLVASIVEQAPGARYVLFRSGDPLQKVAPVTSDEKGLLLLMRRLRSAWRNNPSASLSKSVQEIAALENPGSLRIVVVTADPVEALPDLKEVKVLFVRVPAGGAGREAPGARRGKNWIRGDQVNELRDFLRENPILPASEPKGRWSYIQMFAALGFCALLAHSVLAGKIS